MTKKLGFFIMNTSREPVVNSFRIIKDRYLPEKQLISKGNKLRKDAVAAIKRHNSNSINFPLKSKDVSTYIAASSLSHLIDGWGYLANAVNAFLRGSPGTAIHLAYYAELRAVMSLLATEGIGVFSDIHLGLESNNTFSIFHKYDRKQKGKGGVSKRFVNPIGTHVFAWEAMDKWCRSGSKPSQDFLQMFQVKGHSFSELLPGFHPQASQLVSSSITKRWLKTWAFDVKKYKNDREFRNSVSYRPQTISDFDKKVDFRTAIKNIYELFHVLSPTTNNPFNYLDKLLLKDLFDSLYEIPDIASRALKENMIKEAFENVGSTLDKTTEAILLPPILPESTPLIFSEAAKLELMPLPVISRAALLLRVSTGCVSALLKDADITKNELTFIWDTYGFNHGFWDSMQPVSEFYKLWDDIEISYSNIDANLTSGINSPFSFNNEMEDNIIKLSQFDRAVFWGL